MRLLFSSVAYFGRTVGNHPEIHSKHTKEKQLDESSSSCLHVAVPTGLGFATRN